MHRDRTGLCFQLYYFGTCKNEPGHSAGSFPFPDSKEMAQGAARNGNRLADLAKETWP